jgi:4-azaleucine resistance transporter AzlC
MTKITTPTPLSEFLAGVRDESPILLGTMPFGLIYGVIATKAGIPPLAAILMSSIVFAGSSQMVVAQLIQVATPGLVIVLIAGIVNLRHALYSASMAPYLKHLSVIWRIGLAYLLTDEAYAVSIAHFLKNDALSEEKRRYQHWHFLGGGLLLWVTWQLATIVGVLVGGNVPSEWGLDFTLALTFIALTIPVLKDRPLIAAAISAGLVAVITYGLPYKLGLLAAAFTGIMVGLLLEQAKKFKRPGDVVQQ